MSKRPAADATLPPSAAPASARGAHLRFEPALDGLRGVAVVSVLLYHGGLSSARGGFLGVEAFFVLSGFLITSLLVSEWRDTGGVGLRAFWGRRARRLLPALFCVVVVTGIQQALAGPSQAVPGFRADGISTLLYYANWNQIIAGNGYFQQTALTSPLQHTWSLAIEEQFYVVWPLLLLGVLALAGRRLRKAGGRRKAGEPRKAELPPSEESAGRERRLRLLLGLAVAGALASALEMALLYHGGNGIDRVYYGTDTRAQGLLTGAALAIGLALVRGGATGLGRAALRPFGRTASRITAAAGALAAAGYVALAATTGGTVHWLYQGGFLAVDVVVAAVILASVSATAGFSPARAALSFGPLRRVGLISYGLYLWHFPLFLWLTTGSTGLGGASLLGLRLAVTLAVSIASYVLVEQPIRRRRIPSVVTRALAPAGLAGALASVLVASSVAAAVPGATRQVRLPRAEQTALEGSASCRVELPFLPVPVFQTFHTCPPARVMLVGDSVGTTLGLELGAHEQRLGVLLANRSVLGCSFVTGGLVDAEGTFERQNIPCARQFDSWEKDAASFHPQAIVVEMGYWDSMDRLVGGRVVHLGEKGFDEEVVARVRALVRDLAPHHQPVVLLSVPWMDPPPFPDGQPQPAASPTRHREINALLAEVARTSHGQVHFFDLGPYVSPSGHYQADVGGGICRQSDGVHFYDGPSEYDIVATYCTERVQAALLPYVRRLIRATRPR